jgi:hypothetical protein
VYLVNYLFIYYYLFILFLVAQFEQSFKRKMGFYSDLISWFYYVFWEIYYGVRAAVLFLMIPQTYWNEWIDPVLVQLFLLSYFGLFPVRILNALILVIYGLRIGFVVNLHSRLTFTATGLHVTFRQWLLTSYALIVWYSIIFGVRFERYWIIFSLIVIIRSPLVLEFIYQSRFVAWLFAARCPDWVIQFFLFAPAWVAFTMTQF